MSLFPFTLPFPAIISEAKQTKQNMEYLLFP